MSAPDRPSLRRRFRHDLGDVALAVLGAFLAFIFINSLGKYSETGDVALLLLAMAFAGWAWWYGEDRDRRHPLPGEHPDDPPAGP